MPQWEYKRGKQLPFLREKHGGVSEHNPASLLRYSKRLFAWNCLKGFNPEQEKLAIFSTRLRQILDVFSTAFTYHSDAFHNVRR